MVASEPPDREAVKSFHGHCSHETNLGPDEAVFSVPRRRLETAPLYQRDRITTGCGDAGYRPELDLPPFPQGRPIGHGGDPGNAPMIEIVIAVMVFLSAGVLLANAFDAFHGRA